MSLPHKDGDLQQCVWGGGDSSSSRQQKQQRCHPPAALRPHIQARLTLTAFFTARTGPPGTSVRTVSAISSCNAHDSTGCSWQWDIKSESTARVVSASSAATQPQRAEPACQWRTKMNEKLYAKTMDPSALQICSQGVGGRR